MKNELHNLLVALDTQIDGVESYLKKIDELANDRRLRGVYPEIETIQFGSVLRVASESSMDIDVTSIRKNLQRMRDAADKFDWSLIGE